MPLEKMRVLSVLVLSAVISSMIAGEFNLFQVLIYVTITVPLWFPINLDHLRELPYWRMLIFLGFIIFVTCRILGIHFQDTLFFLIFCSIIYEYYGEKREKAPVRLISLLSFLFILSLVRQNYRLSLLLSLAVYMVGVIWVLMNYNTGGIRIKDYALAFKKRVPRAVVHTGLISLIGLGVFWFIPRIPDQTMTLIGNLSTSRLSGFSDHVTLNDIGSLKLSRKHILDLTPLDGVLHSNYLKGKVLDLYQDGIWTTSFPQPYFLPASAEDSFVIHEDYDSQIKRYRYRIDLEPLKNSTIFFFNDVLGFEGKQKHLKITGTPTVAGMNQAQVFRFYPTAINYTLHCAAEGTYVDLRNQLSNYLQMPSELDYFLTKGTEILNEAGAVTEIEKVQTFQKYFLDQFTYTLDIHNQNAKDPLREFFEVQKKGHCELFASSMVMLLRSQGIPARLVTGFLVPKKHPTGDFYSITEGDAHAWVEVYQEGRWLTVDPTPPATFVERSYFETQLAYLNYLWRNKIILWDADSQSALLSSFLREFRTFFSWLKKDGWQFIVFLLLALAGIRWLFYWRQLQQTTYLSRLFSTLDEHLQKVFGKRPAQIPLIEWLQGQSLDHALKGELVGWVNAYQLRRFGQQESQPTEPLIRQGKQLKVRLKHISMT